MVSGHRLGHTVFAAFLSGVAGLLVVLAVAGPASAQRALCQSLQAELAAVETGRGAGSSSRYKEYDRAVRQQEVQIRKTERAAQRNGCHARRSNVCQRINSSLAAMVANLESLRRQRDRLAPRKATSSDRERIIRAMRNNGCVDDDRSTVTVRQQQPSGSGRRTLLEQIFGTKTYSDTGAYGESDPALQRRFGTFRTLCVRTCDGYYFPISFSTTSDRFAADEVQCEKMCPGTETALYFHPMALSGFGLLLAALSGLLSLFFDVPFMTGLWATPNILGVEVDVSTPLVFDIGVYFVVVGSITSVALALEEREHE